MNERSQFMVDTRRHSGRVYLGLGIIIALAGIGIYSLQLRASILIAPWYAAIMATGGVALIVLALLRARSLWRWAALVVFTLLAGFEWLSLLVFFSTPAYTGPVKAGQPFPAFSTTLADGSTFTQDDLKGDQHTVMVFFRGWW